MPKLSVIVPVFNTEKYLEKCLLSLVEQTLDDIEVIVVNDGSTDNSDKIIQAFYMKYPTKIIPLSKPNGGLSDARNFGIQRANGDYIGFVDSDDYIDKSMYEEMYKLAVQDDADFVECDFSWDFTNSLKKDIGTKYKTIQDYFTHGRVMACNKIYKTSLIKTQNIFFPKGLLYEDIEFFYKLVPHIKNSSYINQSFYHYVQRDNSIINSNGEKTNDIFIILANIVDYYKKQSFYTNYEKYLEYLYIRLLLGSSFLRIIKIKNKKIRKCLLAKTYSELYNKFPNWKHNVILNESKSKKNIYYKTINKFTYKVYSIIFRLF